MSASRAWDELQRRLAAQGDDDSDIEPLTEEGEEGIEEEQDEHGEVESSAPPRVVTTGATTWQEVDRGELSASALALISSIAQTAPTDDKSRDAVWHPTTTMTVTQELVDPLGMGRIDAVNMKLERGAQRESAPVMRGSAAGVNVDTGAVQAKGAVGRFFSELMARGKSGVVPAAAAGGGVGSPGSPGGGRGPLDGGPSVRRRGASAAAKAALNLPQHMLLPTMEGFDPEAYLAVFHEGTSTADLAMGLQTLEKELGERQGQLQQLVKQNFDRFISCKTTIDDIYVKLQRIESAGTGISTQVLFSAVQEVQGSAKRAFGPLLERHSKAERIKSVQALLRRFQSLFSMPSRVRALAAGRDYEQVCAEYKKANALIRPSSSNTAKVWARLHTEIEKRVGEVWVQLEGEVQQPDLLAATAPDLLLHMLALQAEGLPLSQGKDPLGMLLEARERRFRTEMAATQERHGRAMARLKERYCLVIGGEAGKADPSRVTEQHLLSWSDAARGADGDGGGGAGASSDGSIVGPDEGGATSLLLLAPAMFVAGASSTAPGVASLSPLASAAPLSVMGSSTISLGVGGGLGWTAPGLAPLSGLQPQSLQSRLVQHTVETPGEQLALSHITDLSNVLLSCLPGFWSVASSSRLADAPDLPPAMRSRLKQSIKAVATTAQRLVESYCKEIQRLAGAVVAVGPLRNATAALVESLSHVIAALREVKAPSSAVDAVLGVLRYSLEAAVRQLAGHLEQLPAILASREAWVVSLTHSQGEAPVTHLPEQLQEEITVAVQYYKALTSTCSAVLDRELPVDITTRPLHVAFFACLGQCMACLAALAERYNPQPGDTPRSSSRQGLAAVAEGDGGSCEPGRSSPTGAAGRRGGTTGRGVRNALLLDSDDEDEEGGAGQGGAAGAGGTRSSLQGGRGGVGVGGVPGVSDDVRLLLTASNLSYIRSRLMGSLTQRFLLVLTGEVASEVERVSRTVKGLAKRMDTALQTMFDTYLERKRRQLDRLMAAYVRADGGPVGVPSELRDITSAVQQLLQAVAQVQAEAYTYARPHTSYLLPPLLEHVASQLSERYAALNAAELPAESTAQYFLDLVWLDGVISAAGPPSMRVDIDAGYMLLAQRIAGHSGSHSGSGVQTPLGRSLAAIKDPTELSKKLQVTCRKLLPDILGRSTFTIRSFLPD